MRINAILAAATVAVLGMTGMAIAGDVGPPITNAVPEPASLVLLAVGAAGVPLLRRRRK